MFLHARKGHVEPFGKGCDRSVRTPKLLQNAAAGGVRERAERGIEVGLAILSHMVQYTTWVMECNGRLNAPLRCPAIHLKSPRIATRLEDRRQPASECILLPKEIEWAG